MKTDEIKKGFQLGLPIVIGYAPVAAAFGLICKTGGFSLFETFAFSFFCVCGSKSVYGSKSSAYGDRGNEHCSYNVSGKHTAFSDEFRNQPKNR